MLTPTLSQFLTELAHLITARDATKLQSYLVIEPPYAPIYTTLQREVQSTFSAHDGTSVARLEATCLKSALGATLTVLDDQGNPAAPTWSACVKFVAQYFIFLRDVDVSNLLRTYEGLSELLGKGNSALNHPILGVLLLPTVVSYSRMLSRLAIGLDKQPHLIAHLIPRPANGDEGGQRETLPERAANILRQAFTTCLNDRSGSPSGLTSSGQPEGKRRGIYTIANLCLKILFQCRKIRGASQIIENIYNQSPPLAAFPKSERVTYLYYLGRFSFANGHYFRAQKALQKAWDECHVRCERQLRLITIYLVAANMICGRFPKRAVLQRTPDLVGKFEPLCLAIRRGDIVEFRKLLTPDGPNSAFFARYRIELQLRNRCEIHVWRSMVRRCFLLCGEMGNAESRKAPTLDLSALLAVWRRQESMYIAQDAQFAGCVDPDFDGADGVEMEGYSSDGFGMPDVISRMSSLIHQDFVNGYLALRIGKLAIIGARTKGALAAGFPNIWTVISARSEQEVPGWKLQMRTGAVFGGAGFGPGQVVNLSGARPVGAS